MGRHSGDGPNPGAPAPQPQPSGGEYERENRPRHYPARRPDSRRDFTARADFQPRPPSRATPGLLGSAFLVVIEEIPILVTFQLSWEWRDGGQQGGLKPARTSQVSPTRGSGRGTRMLGRPGGPFGALIQPGRPAGPACAPCTEKRSLAPTRLRAAEERRGGHGFTSGGPWRFRIEAWGDTIAATGRHDAASRSPARQGLWENSCSAGRRSVRTGPRGFGTAGQDRSSAGRLGRPLGWAAAPGRAEDGRARPAGPVHGPPRAGGAVRIRPFPPWGPGSRAATGRGEITAEFGQLTALRDPGQPGRATGSR